jgi:hypothetical protein
MGIAASALGVQNAFEHREQAGGAGESEGRDGKDGAKQQRDGHGRGAASIVAVESSQSGAVLLKAAQVSMHICMRRHRLRGERRNYP